MREQHEKKPIKLISLAVSFYGVHRMGNYGGRDEFKRQKVEYRGNVAIIELNLLN